MYAHADCYGTMFPDLSRLKPKERLEGQAFTARVVGSGTRPYRRSLGVKVEAWEACVACPDYRTCFDLSLAKLELNDVLRTTTVTDAWVGE